MERRTWREVLRTAWRPHARVGLPSWLQWAPAVSTSLLLHGGLLFLLGVVVLVRSGSGSNEVVQIDTELIPERIDARYDTIAPVETPGAELGSLDVEAPSVEVAAAMPIATTPSVDTAGPAALGTTIDTGALGSGGGPGEAIRAGRLGELVGARSLGGGPGGLGSPFGSRTGTAKAALVRAGGGSVPSERAVTRGLEWLQRHQRPDGGWGMDPTPQCDGQRKCPPGKAHDSDTAATGLALLPLLGAGHHHEADGPFKDTIRRGLDWLKAKQSPEGDLRSGAGNMYSHAIATMALCEAYGLTKDPTLQKPAQRAIDFIVKAQNKEDGGWRYAPGEPGDTSVFGWQLFALRSAYLAGLDVPDETVSGARKYLDRAAADPIAATYCYQPGKGMTHPMTAEGLLCRQYLGWTANNPALQQGVQKVSEDLLQNSAKQRNLYYWYYATQLLHNVGGPLWQQWNAQVRDRLVQQQVIDRSTCAYGSFHPTLPLPDAWGKDAGRHFTTCLAILTLEVYYRYLPLYSERGNPIK
jgi:hypothetical protein